jgi:hypothetical protein
VLDEGRVELALDHILVLAQELPFEALNEIGVERLVLLLRLAVLVCGRRRLADTRSRAGRPFSRLRPRTLVLGQIFQPGGVSRCAAGWRRGWDAAD